MSVPLGCGDSGLGKVMCGIFPHDSKLSWAPGFSRAHLLNHLLDFLLLAMDHVIQVSDPLSEAG